MGVFILGGLGWLFCLGGLVGDFLFGFFLIVLFGGRVVRVWGDVFILLVVVVVLFFPLTFLSTEFTYSLLDISLLIISSEVVLLQREKTKHKS